MYFVPSQKSTAGFTIIEMLVALALFTIVITIAVGAFLSLISGSSSLQGEQAVMSSLSFAMDTMTREIRTGTNYYCKNDAGSNQMTLDETRNCSTGSPEFSFVEAGSSLSSGSGSERISYSYVDDPNDSSRKTIVRQLGDNNNSPQESILSSDTKLIYAQFFVTGADPLRTGSDVAQPTVTIVVKAQDPADSSKTYTLETTVTQRQLDL